MNKTAYLSLVCAALLIAGGLYYFLREEPSLPDSTPIVEQNPAQPASNLTFAGSSIIEEKNGKKVWEINAETIEADTSGKLVYLTNLTGIFYQENGGKLELVAQKGVLDTKTHDITLQGDIKATSSEGAVFTAPEGRYSEQTKHFTGTGGITLTRGDTVITGDTIDADTETERVKVQGNARVVTGGKNP
ncbi:LPS export ABC transporter periplasmic protein LptC [Sporomusa acidovorans]|uniref:Lipopolysaccharide-assembly, LptC-related n=1 Tax=Sporomusa acidovorans (strain ATCC 49682 / DSM 3132 / Mol) TaxID=1123286 RepID=A0ABZ3J806_SPOA4|nr:LPS export ABC transporter periplasmic protein LptC [Sporomusa acidovorans]OZC19307.1 LPS-assembly protein LptD [Sporomusa acidovorans DSM 3132]SDD81213.1 Lipopolysaccharide-assembly, LptC-related [Sporomusa acidovorans]